MSWDVLLQRFPKNTARPEGVPEGYLPPPLGSRAEVAAAIKKLVRNVDTDGESFVTIERPRYAIEIELGDEEPCSQLLLHVHDDHALASKTILRIAEHFAVRALDCSTSEFLEARSKHDDDQQRPKKKTRPMRPDRTPEGPPLPLERLPGVVMSQPCVRFVYVSLLAGESLKKLQKVMYRGYIAQVKGNTACDALVMGPSWKLTLPDGQPLGSFSITRYPTQVTETEAEMIPRVQKGVELVREIAAAAGRLCGEIENGSTFVCHDGRRIPLSACTYRTLTTDADYAWKFKPKRNR